MALFESIPVEAEIKSDFEKTGVTTEYWLKAANLPRAAKTLYAEGWHIEDLSALDFEEGILVEYHFDRMSPTGRIVLKVMAEGGKVPSIADIFQGANWHEREVRDFHAVDFTGHPNLWPLLLPVDLEPGVLLKEDKVRKPLREVLTLGEAKSVSPFVEALFAEPEAEAADEAAAE